jgi:uncharacterized Tic20 family protein
MSTSPQSDESGTTPTSETQPPPGVRKDEHTWALFAHLSALLVYLGIPFGLIVGPLIIWLIKRNEMPFVDDQGKEAVNFNISVLIYLVVAGLSLLVLIGFLLVPVVVIGHIILTVMATIEASKGHPYRYPLTIRFIK